MILPKNIFAKTPATTAVLFFQKGSSTKSIWFYKLKPEKGMNFGITNPLTEDNLDDFRERFKTKSISENSWNTKIEELNDQTFSLPIMHPDADPLENMTPSEEIKKSLMELGAETNALIEKIGSIK